MKTLIGFTGNATFQGHEDGFAVLELEDIPVYGEQEERPAPAPIEYDFDNFDI